MFGKKRSLNVQIATMFLFLLILPIAGIGFYLFQTVKQDMAEVGGEQIINMSSSVARLMENEGKELLTSVEMNARWNDFRNAVAQKNAFWIEENINIAKDSSSNIDFVFTCDREGNILSKTDEIAGFSEKVPAIVGDRIRENAKFSGIIPVQNGTAILAASPISDEAGTAQSTGWLIYGRNVDQAMLAEMKGTLQADISLLTAAQSFLTTDATVTPKQLTASLSQALSTKEYQLLNFSERDGLESVEMYTPVHDLAGNIIGVKGVSQSLAAITQIKQEMKKAALISCSIILFSLLLLLTIIRKRMLSPIRQLAGIINDVANGEMRAQLDPRQANRKDELGTLFASLAIMLRNMRSLMKEINETATDNALQLVASAEELASTAEQSSHSNQQIVRAIQGIAGSAEKVIGEATHANAMIGEMNAGIGRITQSSTHVAESTFTTSQEAIQGREIVETAVAQMRTVHQSFRNLDRLVHSVGESSREIETIIRFITEIASQTNLLALNAAIEAARAGEHGRGFAVVAEQIRKLAEQTAASSNQIKQIVEVMQQHSMSSTSAVAGVNADINRGLASFQAAGEIFQRIVQSIQLVHEQTSAVHETSEALSASSEKVNIAIVNTSLYAKASVDDARTVALAAEEQLEAFKEVSTSSERLQSSAYQLQHVLKNVKI
ncbi:HAMP domain-containing protein [Brevibacillus fluminis]|uniref:HAMP domain-containing protein n=1 Tax=Brevibacillus fluminis TaxID=511487 RepID=A0A3M8DNQ0_9BACL|nr:methyl-accepting chemotaxis protein [Brevibacillus fluminis]RNB89713.1 HAMP domain-containing protein [Brevibacillus fluminis]